MKKYFVIMGVVLILVLAGFYVTKAVINKDIKNTSWRLTGWNVDSLSTDVATITLKFEKDKISGNGGVNSYSGNYNIGFSKQLNFTAISSTEMASENADINRAEGIYSTLLTEVRYYKMDNNSMYLLDKNKNTLLIFEKN